MRKTARAVLAAAMLAAPAAAQTVSATAPDSVAGALVEAGFAARLERSRQGDPQIAAATPGGLPFRVVFFGCVGGADCRSLQLVAAFAARDVPLATVNGWNAAMRFGRVHLAEDGRPVLSLDIAGALAPAGMAEQLRLWEQLMETVLALLPD